MKSVCTKYETDRHVTAGNLASAASCDSESTDDCLQLTFRPSRQMPCLTPVFVPDDSIIDYTVENASNLTSDSHEAASIDSDVETVTREAAGEESYLRFRAHGKGMAPFIRNGDTIIVEPVEAHELNIGDVISFWSTEGRHEVRRLVEMTGNHLFLMLITRGDNLRHIDAAVYPEQVLGRVVRIESGNRRLRIAGRSGRVLNNILLWTISGNGRVRNLLRKGLTRLWWLAGSAIGFAGSSGGKVLLICCGLQLGEFVLNTLPF